MFAHLPENTRLAMAEDPQRSAVGGEFNFVWFSRAAFGQEGGLHVSKKLSLFFIVFPTVTELGLWHPEQFKKLLLG